MNSIKTKPTLWTLKQNGAFADLYEGERLMIIGVEINCAGRVVRAVNAHEELLGVAHAFVEHLQNCGDKPTPELLQAIAKEESL